MSSIEGQSIAHDMGLLLYCARSSNSREVSGCGSKVEHGKFTSACTRHMAATWKPSSRLSPNHELHCNRRYQREVQW